MRAILADNILIMSTEKLPGNDLVPLVGLFFQLISPTHKRTEGRAPVWGSELTSKDAAIQGDPE